MQEMNDRARAADECHSKYRDNGEKECDLGDKISPRVEREVVAPNLKKRRPQTSSRAAVKAVEREGLKIAIDQRKPGFRIFTSPIRVLFGIRFHRSLTFLL